MVVEPRTAVQVTPLPTQKRSEENEPRVQQGCPTAPQLPPVQAPVANPTTNPTQPATTPQQQPTALPQDQPAPEQAKPGVAGTPQKPAGNPK